MQNLRRRLDAQTADAPQAHQRRSSFTSLVCITIRARRTYLEFGVGCDTDMVQFGSIQTFSGEHEPLGLVIAVGNAREWAN